MSGGRSTIYVVGVYRMTRRNERIASGGDNDDVAKVSDVAKEEERSEDIKLNCLERS